MHPQTLRKYERIGLVVPTRTMGMLRLYSEVDIARLRLIKHLVAERGLNLDGVQTVLSIFNRLVKMKLIVEKNSDSRLKIAITDVLDEIFDDLSVEFS
jgi:MerR family transcriptional regulator/heat shock protein HspR